MFTIDGPLDQVWLPETVSQIIYSAMGGPLATDGHPKQTLLCAMVTFPCIPRLIHFKIPSLSIIMVHVSAPMQLQNNMLSDYKLCDIIGR